MQIGERIKARRLQIDMSQDELAKKVGYKSRSSINKIELDGRGLPYPKIIKIAEALQVTPSYLMGWEDEKTEISVKHNRDFKTGRTFEKLTSEESLLLDLYSKLNSNGKKEAIKRINELTQINIYTDSENATLNYAARSRETDIELVSDIDFTEEPPETI